MLRWHYDLKDIKEFRTKRLGGLGGSDDKIEVSYWK